MDDTRFDHLTRHLAGSGSRRAAVGGVLAGVVALALGEGRDGEARRGGRGTRRGGARHDRGREGAPGVSPARKKKKCKAGLLRCGTACVATATDPANCGACGNACDGGTTCQGGACVCPFGQTVCAGTCVNIETSPANCGACGAVCDSLTTDGCVGGACTCGGGPACPSGQGCCGGTCRVLTDPQNCGACGNVCPGYGTAFANVSCLGGTCGFSCQGDHYDVDNDPGNGCETTIGFTVGHTQGTAIDLGSVDCFDTSTKMFSSRMVSDGRAHEQPSVNAFASGAGAAPQWWKVLATGGVCSNDLNVVLTLIGATDNCYRLTVVTDKGTFTATATGGTASIVRSVGQYTDNSTVSIGVEKICGTTTREIVPFAVSFNL